MPKMPPDKGLPEPKKKFSKTFRAVDLFMETFMPIERHKMVDHVTDRLEPMFKGLAGSSSRILAKAIAEHAVDAVNDFLKSKE